MPRFLLLLSPEHRSAVLRSAAELGRRTSDFVTWVGELRQRGVIRSGARLAPGPRRITRGPEGACVSPEGGASVDLFFVVEAPDWDAALALAVSCPGADPGTIDVFALDGSASIPVEISAALTAHAAARHPAST